MSDDNDPTLEHDMRTWLRDLVDAVVTDPAERERRYQEIDRALAALTEPEDEEPTDE